ncbi:MAG: hypothetical protein K8F91_16600 [Candidatus Obscuribacterales bacterium]|nr:hypothetical protein [Candidatus Obscuribacterales bacterium]
MRTLGNLFKLSFWSKSRAKCTISTEDPITLVLPTSLKDLESERQESFAPMPTVLCIDSGIFPELMPVIVD